jgi:hypothetical protein
MCSSFKSEINYIKEEKIKYYDIEHFKCVPIDIFIDMFGNFFSYNLLNKYIENNDYIDDLKVVITRKKEEHNSEKNISVFIDDEFIENIQLEENNNPIMFYHFQQLKYDDKDNED